MLYFSININFEWTCKIRKRYLKTVSWFFFLKKDRTGQEVLTAKMQLKSRYLVFK